MRNLVSYAEYVVIMSGGSDRQLVAVAHAIEREIQAAGRACRGVEGQESGRWVLMDFGDVVAHVFHEPVRQVYDLEGMWHEAPQLQIPGYDRKRDQLGLAQFG